MFSTAENTTSPPPLGKNPEQLLYNLNQNMREAVLPVTVFVGIEVFLGFFGNLLILYVFLFRYHACNFKYFVLCLAFTDFTSSLTTMPGEMVTQLFWYMYPVPMVCKVKSFFNVYTVCSEALCLLTIAVDRFRKVCKPLGWQIKPGLALKLCFVIYAVAFVLALPVAFLWGTHHREMNISGVIVNATICEKDEKFKDTKYPLAYSATVEAVVCVTLFVMLVLYIFVARSLFRKRSDLTYSLSTRNGIRTMNFDSKSRSSSPNPSRMDASDCAVSSSASDAYESPTGGAKDGNKSATYKINTNNNISCRDNGDRKASTLPVPKITFTLGPPSGETTNLPLNGVQEKPTRVKNIDARVRRKTLIMFILTAVFIITTVLYFTLLSFIAREDNILQKMSNGGRAAYFFFFRLYFINHVINPVLYGLLDPTFRKVMKTLHKTMSSPFLSASSQTNTSKLNS